MTMPPRILGMMMALVVVAGLAIGALAAVLKARPGAPDTAVAVATGTPLLDASATYPTTPGAPARTRAPAPAVQRTAAPTPRATTAPTAAPTTTSEPLPTNTPVLPTNSPVPSANTPPGVAPAGGSLAGTWLLSEANAAVGTIVWSGTAVQSPDGSVAFEVHKASVAGRPAMPCERQTTLHIAIPPGARSAVPYQEVNCAGEASGGQVQVGPISAGGRSFTGSFWRGNVKLGDFVARKQ